MHGMPVCWTRIKQLICIGLMGTMLMEQLKRQLSISSGRHSNSPLGSGSEACDLVLSAYGCGNKEVCS